MLLVKNDNFLFESCIKKSDFRNTNISKIQTSLSKMDIVSFIYISARLNQLINIVQFLIPHLRWGSTDLCRGFLTDLKAGKGPLNTNRDSRGVCMWNGLLVVRLQIKPSVSLFNQLLYFLFLGCGLDE